MKKYFYLAAVSAMMLTACSSDKDVLETKTGPAQQEIAQKAVGFDVYVPTATAGTRSGLEGTMTTGRMQRSDANGGGFGVYAFLTEDADGTSGATSYTSTAGQKPNFMFNEKILWNSSNLGWYYSPLKYWPNETNQDSQNTPAYMESSSTQHLDRLTFFAYAPYVSAGGGTTGIIAISDANGQKSGSDVKNPTIGYVSTDSPTDVDPDKYVDLLWGVAPAGGLSYTAVNGTTKTVGEGLPLIDMVKPDVNTSMKFLFNHALARIGLNVVAAIDQVSPGGELDPNTKITIDKLTISGPFGITGDLDLNNGTNKNIANWIYIEGTAVNNATTNVGSTQSITVTANATNKAIAANLRWTGPHNAPVVQPVVGVTTAKQDLLAPSNKWFVAKVGSSTPYSPAKQYYTNNVAPLTPAVAHYTTVAGDAGKYYTKTTGTPDYYTVVSTGTALDSPVYPAVATKYYKLTETGSYLQTGSDPGKTTGYYTKSGGVYTYVSSSITWGTGSETYYTVEATPVLASEIAFAYTGDIYEAERNYLYVIPTNNVAKNSGASVDALRTITVEIEYYITTEDSKLAAGRAQTKNVITKTVVLPSLANGKSYMLNLVLGLTSVKIEAEVDDWKVENVQADLPQNTAE